MFSRRVYFPALAAVVFLATAAVRAEDALADKPVEKAGIAIQLPKGWQVDDHAASHTLLLARAPVRDKDDTGEFQTLLMVSTDAGAKIDGAAQQARVAKNFANYNYKVAEEPEAVTIKGLDGVKFGGTLTLGSVKLRTRQYMLLHESRIYTVTFMSLESLWGTYAAAIDASAATFTIAGK